MCVCVCAAGARERIREREGGKEGEREREKKLRVIGGEYLRCFIVLVLATAHSSLCNPVYSRLIKPYVKSTWQVHHSLPSNATIFLTD